MAAVRFRPLRPTRREVEHDPWAANAGKTKNEGVEKLLQSQYKIMPAQSSFGNGAAFPYPKERTVGQLPRLTDKQRKQIIADYAELGSYRAVAKQDNVAAITVKRIIEADTEVAQKVAQKKEENTKEVLAHMEARKAQACGVIDKLLDALGSDEKIGRAPLVQIATSMGIVIDKFTMNEDKQNANGDDGVHIHDDV